MSSGYTRVHRTDLLGRDEHHQPKAPDAADTAADALLDAMYRNASPDASRCVVYFGSKHYAKDYIPLTIRYDREFISYDDGDGYVRYAFCDAMIGGEQCDFDFGYLQDEDGEVKMFVKQDGSMARLGFETRPQAEELEPVAAWVRNNFIYLVMNTPSADMLATVAPRDRLPMTSENGGRAFGSMSLWKIPIGEGRIERTDLTTPMDGWCVSVIPNADTGRPGVMVINMDPHARRETQPRDFESLIAAMRSVTAISREVEVPLGVSVYDPEEKTFTRVSLDGHVGWGIGSIELIDDAHMPDDVASAMMDNMGVGVLVYKTEEEEMREAFERMIDTDADGKAPEAAEGTTDEGTDDNGSDGDEGEGNPQGEAADFAEEVAK